MTTFTVDEDEDLIGPQATKCRRTHGIGSVGDRWSRKVEGWRQPLDDLHRFRGANRLDLLRGDDVNRYRPFRLRTWRTRADRDFLGERQRHRDVVSDGAGGQSDLAEGRGKAGKRCLNFNELPSRSARRNIEGIASLLIGNGADIQRGN